MTDDQHIVDAPTAASKTFDSEKVVSNILALGSGEIVARVIAFIGVAYLARELGPSGFGIIGFAAALCGYLSLAVSAGFNDIGAREVARRPHEASEIAASVILVKFALAIVALAAIGIVAWFLDKPPTVKLVVALTGLSFFSLALDTAWVYKGLERNRRVGLALVFGQVLYVGTVLLVVRGPGDVMFVPLAQFLGEMSAALFLAVSVFRLGKIKPDLREGFHILRSSGFLTLSRLLRTLIFTFDVVLLGFLLGEREVGLYTAPYRFCFLLLAITVAIHVSYLPALTRAFTQGTRQVADLAERSVEFSSAFCVPMIVGGMILSGSLLDTLFGPGYLEGAAAFQLLILSIGFIFISGATHNILLVYDRTKVEMWIVATAAGLNIGLNIILIPLYGLVGAAVATATAEGLILLMGLFAIYKIGIRIKFWSALRPLIAAGVMGAGLIALGPGQKLVVYLGLGLVIYVSALVIFRGVPRDAKPHLLNITFFFNRLHERSKGIWHFLIGPTAEQVDEVKSILSDRQYYHLYDDFYREVNRTGCNSDFRKEGVRNIVYRDFERQRTNGLLPGPGASLIDLGCGEGINAVHFVKLGFRVTGVDISSTAIDMATSLASEKNLEIDFRIADVLDLAEFPDNSFDLATDIGCLHMLVRKEHRHRYLKSVRRVLRPKGVFFMFNRVTSRDFKISDEDRCILQSVTLVQERWIPNTGISLKARGCGFRPASMRQYQQELEAVGFELVSTHRGWDKHRPFGMFLVRVP